MVGSLTVDKFNEIILRYNEILKEASTLQDERNVAKLIRFSAMSLDSIVDVGTLIQEVVSLRNVINAGLQAIGDGLKDLREAEDVSQETYTEVYVLTAKVLGAIQYEAGMLDM